MRKLLAAAATLAAVLLAACGERPTENSEVQSAMPDTAAPRNPDTAMTAPDSRTAPPDDARTATPPPEETPR